MKPESPARTQSSKAGSVWEAVSKSGSESWALSHSVQQPTPQHSENPAILRSGQAQKPLSLLSQHELLPSQCRNH